MQYLNGKIANLHVHMSISRTHACIKHCVGATNQYKSCSIIIRKARKSLLNISLKLCEHNLIVLVHISLYSISVVILQCSHFLS